MFMQDSHTICIKFHVGCYIATNKAKKVNAGLLG